MSPNRSRTPKSDSHTHTGRRRHAAPKEPRWARRAGLVGGVFSAFALGGAAAPALADNNGPHAHTSHTVRSDHSGNSSRTPTGRASWSQASTLSTAFTARRAVAAVEWEARAAAFTAQREQDRAEAAEAARLAQQAAHRKAEAAAKKARAAKQRAAAKAAAQAAAARAKAAAAIPAASATPAPTVTAAVAKAAAPAPTATAGKVDQLIAFLKAQLGKPYVYGATGPDSYDCSGLAQAAFATIGIDLPRTSQEQSTVGTPVSLSDLQVGDLVFWGGEGSAYHVAVYIGDNQFLAAQNPSMGVVIEPMDFSMPDWAVRVL